MTCQRRQNGRRVFKLNRSCSITETVRTAASSCRRSSGRTATSSSAPCTARQPAVYIALFAESIHLPASIVSLRFSHLGPPLPFQHFALEPGPLLCPYNPLFIHDLALFLVHLLGSGAVRLQMGSLSLPVLQQPPVLLNNTFQLVGKGGMAGPFGRSGLRWARKRKDWRRESWRRCDARSRLIPRGNLTGCLLLISGARLAPAL